MAKLGSSWLALAAFAFVLCAQAWGLQLLLPFGGQRCFSEDFDAGMTARCDFHARNRNGTLDLNVEVRNARNRVIVHRQTVGHEKFSFNVPPAHPRRGKLVHRYKFCLRHVSRKRVYPQTAESMVTFHVEQHNRRQIELMLAGATRAAHNERLAEVRRAAASVADMQKKVTQVITNFDVWRRYEETMMEENNTMIQAVLRTSVLTCVIIVIIGALQSEACRFVIGKKKQY